MPASPHAVDLCVYFDMLLKHFAFVVHRNQNMIIHLFIYFSFGMTQLDDIPFNLMDCATHAFPSFRFDGQMYCSRKSSALSFCVCDIFTEIDTNKRENNK